MRTNESRGDLKGGASRFISIVGMVGLIVGLGGLASRTARAEIQNDLVGFSPNHVFESTDAGEHIDVMSGNLTLTIPLGPRYKLTDNFGYGVTLYYNAKIWEHDCPVVHLGGGEVPICPGDLPTSDTYGLGFSLIPGRVYHHEKDKSFVYRIQLEDGSEHFFCDIGAGSGYTSGVDQCGEDTNDSAHVHVVRNDSTGWRASTTDGRRIEFSHLASDGSFLATRVSTIATRPNGDPRAQVDYVYSPGSDAIQTISDSQGRTITFAYGPNLDVTISFPSFANSEGFQPGTRSDYVLRRGSLTFKDPSDGVGDRTKKVLQQIEFPGLNSQSEVYKFAYMSGGGPSYGWLTRRTLPTGAVIDYSYDVYGTSEHRPYHTELVHKTLTLGGQGGQSYRWSWNRFNIEPPRYPPLIPSADPEHPSPSFTLSGSNPYRVAARDPFNNLTVYEFEYTGYDSVVVHRLCNSLGECLNNWDDGLLTSVSTFAGPNPDTAQLVRRVSYVWDSDTDESGNHLMFRYRTPTGAHDDSFSPPRINTMARNARQVEERTFTPGAGGGHLVTVKSSKWYPYDRELPPPGNDPFKPSIVPRQRDEYLDGALYRRTYTKTEPSGGDWGAHLYVEVKDALERVVSHVDRTFIDGQIECEVRRKGAFDNQNGIDCDNPSLEEGDIEVINTFDDDPGPTNATGAVIETTIKGGDGSPNDSRTIIMSYLPNATGDNSAYLKTRKYEGDWSWKEVNRKVDFNTGLTMETQTPAGHATQYQWDALGRLTGIVPTLHEKPTVIEYSSLHETKVRQDLTAGNYIETVYLYDDLGRLTTTKKRNAVGAFDVQITEFDAANRVTRKSEWAPDGTPTTLLKWTTYDYTIFTDMDGPQGATKYPDPLGRIHGVTTPDDPTPLTPTTETRYDGDTTFVTVRDIRGSVNGLETSLTSTTTYVKDALGRLISVDSPGTGADAVYLYDESDNLTEVRLTDPATPSQVQVRHFDYDNLGRLRLASNPENGTIQYLSYDARGNLLSYLDARHNVFNLTYDAADRLLTRVQGGLELVKNTYDSSSDLIPAFDAGGSAGKLVEQIGSEIENGSSIPVSRIRLTYGAAGSPVDCTIGSGYSGLNGRLISQSSEIRPPGMTLKTEYCQDALGVTTTVGYPDATDSGRTRTRAVSTYSNGALVGLVDGGRGRAYITNVAYAAGGVPKEVDRAARKDLIDLDVRNRPARIQSIGYNYSSSGGGAIPCALVQSNPSLYPALAGQPCGDGESGGNGSWIPYTIWDSGQYAYDMAGNVTTIGSEEYYYDALSRVVQGSVPGVGLTYFLDFVYDGFGNMSLQRRTMSSAPSSPIERNYTIDWRTNRLIQKTSTSGPASVTYTHDENGNLTAAGSRGFVFDGQGRLQEVMDPEKGRIGSYDYDPSGYRVRAEADGNETFYFRDASGQVLSEFQRPLGNTNPPVWNKDYIYALGKSHALVKNQIPTLPKRPWATSVISTSLLLHWWPVSDPDILGYSLRRVWKKTELSAESTTYTNLPASSLSYLDGYAGSTVYLKYSLAAMDSAGNLSDYGPELIVYPNTETSPPTPPTNVTATGGDRSVTIRWTPPVLTNNALLGYFVERYNIHAGHTWGTWVRLNDFLLTTPEFLDTPLSNGVIYTYHVFAVDTANRTSNPSEAVGMIPSDSVPPGKIADVYAEPGRVAGRVDISWKRGVDTDVASYVVYRSVTVGDFSSVRTVDVVPGQESYTTTDTAAQGQTYYYSVAAVDTSGNVSVASDSVSVRPRSSTVNTPVLSSTPLTFTIDDNGTTPTAGIGAEDDDILKVMVSWQRAVPDDHPSKYRVYRKASDELRFTRVGTVDWTGAAAYTFPDTSVTKADYTYCITAWNDTTLEESAATPASGAAGSAPDHVIKAFVPANVMVRDLNVEDGRHWYTTRNNKSRVAFVRWSRVVEPGLVGYNVYRSCEFGILAMHFACEATWTLLNTAPLSPLQRQFNDTTVAGLQGYYDYMVRPVGPNGVEGYVNKVVSADLGTWQATDEFHWDAAASLAYIPSFHCYLDPGDPACPDISSIPIATVLSGIHSAPRGPAQPIQAPTEATYAIMDLSESVYSTKKYAQIFWTMGASPSNLLGFHIETAGSPDGPWQRLTKHPVAWWERRYVTTGVWVERCTSNYGGHTECLNYRVIAVDVDGNESQPLRATKLSWSPSCPMTPAPPANLRASNGPLVDGSCTTRLDWDASPGATEYIIYRAVDSGVEFFFYDTQRVTGQTYYIEEGLDHSVPDNSTCPDLSCPYLNDSNEPCGTIWLDAYYVVARFPTGGESPRSNLVFWKCNITGDPGYASVLTTENPADAIASLGPGPSVESLACWKADGTAPDATANPIVMPGVSATQSVLATAPMSRLGQLMDPDPPWEVLDLHTDHLGTVRAITDSSGDLVSLHNYFPFGEEIPTLQFSHNTHQYTGHERDKETGLDYMLARYYEAGLGRFISNDSVRGTLESPQTWNGFSYTDNNPLRYIDPDGQDLRDAVFDFLGGVLRGAAASISNGVTPGSAPQVGDSPASLTGQLVGSALVTLQGIEAAVGGATEAVLTAPACATGIGCAAPAMGVTVAVVGSAVIAGGISNMGKISDTASSGGGAESERNPAQDKRLSSGEIKSLEKAGHDVHELKGGKGASKLDLFKDDKGNVIVKPKSGDGTGEPTGININELKK